MSATVSSRERIWQKAFKRDPCLVPAEPTEWLSQGAAAFTSAVFDLVASGEFDEELQQDLAGVIRVILPEGSEDAAIRSAVNEGLTRLVKSCLRPGTTAELPGDEESLKRREDAIRTARWMLLRVVHGVPSQPDRFPVWFQFELLDNALEAIGDDCIAYTRGLPARAKQLAVMLAANVAAIRNREQLALFNDLLKRLTNRSEDYRDPFLRDRVFIISRLRDLPGVVGSFRDRPSRFSDP